MENNQAGSLTYPQQIGSLKKGAHVLIKGFPCKIIDISTSKTGKHGHAKANYVGIDIFTGKNMKKWVQLLITQMYHMYLEKIIH